MKTEWKGSVVWKLKENFLKGLYANIKKKKIDLGVRVKKSLRTPAISEAKIRKPDKIAWYL